MGVEPEPVTEQQSNRPPISHRRLLIKMMLITAAGTIGGLIFGSPRIGLGFLIGGAVALGNFFWQRHSIKVIFDRAIEGKATPMLGLRYIVRYVVLSLVVAIVYLSDIVSISAVIAGLASFSIAVLIEGLSNIFNIGKQVS